MQSSCGLYSYKKKLVKSVLIRNAWERGFICPINPLKYICSNWKNIKIGLILFNQIVHMNVALLTLSYTPLKKKFKSSSLYSRLIIQQRIQALIVWLSIYFNRCLIYWQGIKVTLKPAGSFIIYILRKGPPKCWTYNMYKMSNTISL